MSGESRDTASKAWSLLFNQRSPNDCTLAFQLASDGAKLGCRHCKGILAYLLYYGCGCEQNVNEALRLAKESADQGSEYGHLSCGRIIYWTDPKNRDIAIEHYMIASKMGLNEALLTVGHMMMLNGLFFRMDKAGGLKLMMQAAEQKHRSAYDAIAKCHEVGDGVPVNKIEAIKWYTMAIEAGYTSSQQALDRLTK
jgi:TPR repeat protein